MKKNILINSIVFLLLGVAVYLVGKFLYEPNEASLIKNAAKTLFVSLQNKEDFIANKFSHFCSTDSVLQKKILDIENRFGKIENYRIRSVRKATDGRLNVNCDLVFSRAGNCYCVISYINDYEAMDYKIYELDIIQLINGELNSSGMRFSLRCINNSLQ